MGCGEKLDTVYPIWEVVWWVAGWGGRVWKEWVLAGFFGFSGFGMGGCGCGTRVDIEKGRSLMRFHSESEAA